MIINDEKIIDQILNSAYELSEYDELDLSDQHVLDELSKINGINIYFREMDDFDSIKNTIRQLCALVDKCPNLENMRLYSFNPDSKRIDVNDLINASIDRGINRVIINGFGCDYSSLYNKILSSDSETMVRLDEIDDSASGFEYIFEKERLRERLKFSSFKDEEVKALYDEGLFRGEISLKNYDKFKDNLTNYKDLYITIANVSELNLAKLESIKNDDHIKGIYVKCGYEKNDESRKYLIEDYEQIRKVIDNIIQKIKLPKDDDPNRDKIIFAQIYKILGKNIRYDNYAISEEGKKGKELFYNCRGLKNGLLGVNRNGKKELLTVCAGYATILQNLCSCLNIRCDYISSESKEIEIPGRYTIFGKEYENGTSDPMGHGYNAVYLDGNAYFCDLTWDANNMKLDKLAGNFLKSYEEFYKSHREEGFSSDNVTVITQTGEVKHSIDPSIFVHSYSSEEQKQLFGIVAKGNIDEMISEGYLADFAMKNIEYIKQVKGKVGITEYIELTQIIHALEAYIKSPDFKERAGWAAIGIDRKVTDENGNVIGENNFIFYPGAGDLSPNDAINEVTKMEEKQWKIK